MSDEDGHLRLDNDNAFSALCSREVSLSGVVLMNEPEGGMLGGRETYSEKRPHLSGIQTSVLSLIQDVFLAGNVQSLGI